MSFKDYLKIKDSALPQLASGFGGGIGHKGSICGALTGAVMAIGMKMGRTDPKDRKTLQKVYDKCQGFWSQFEKEFGNINCYNIIGIHLDNEEERQRWLAAGGREKCGDLVEKTAHILSDLLYEDK
ncbi:MAG: C-GCAxxG-C-C family protein [Thermodesulfobacteriota bacterium]